MPPSPPIEAPLADAVEVLSHLHRGDTLAHCQATGWRLVRTDLPVDDATVRALQQMPKGRPSKRPSGRIAARLPLDDGLPGLGASQTWAWVEGSGRVRG